jgi:hypothetical protein
LAGSKEINADTVIKRAGQPWPNVAELNAKIPQEEWEIGLDGEPRPPWVKQFVVYLLDPRDASIFTFINSTTGAAIAVDRLKEKVCWMRTLRGERVAPIVQLGNKAMKTKYGQKLRPDFVVVDWRCFIGVRDGTVPQIVRVGQPVAPLSVAEELNDKLPF